jgi:hypothetical protein
VVQFRRCGGQKPATNEFRSQLGICDCRRLVALVLPHALGISRTLDDTLQSILAPEKRVKPRRQCQQLLGVLVASLQDFVEGQDRLLHDPQLFPGLPDALVPFFIPSPQSAHKCAAPSLWDK